MNGTACGSGVPVPVVRITGAKSTCHLSPESHCTVLSHPVPGAQDPEFPEGLRLLPAQGGHLVCSRVHCPQSRARLVLVPWPRRGDSCGDCKWGAPHRHKAQCGVVVGQPLAHSPQSAGRGHSLVAWEGTIVASAGRGYADTLTSLRAMALPGASSPRSRAAGAAWDSPVAPCSPLGPRPWDRICWMVLRRLGCSRPWVW